MWPRSLRTCVHFRLIQAWRVSELEIQWCFAQFGISKRLEWRIARVSSGSKFPGRSGTVPPESEPWQRSYHNQNPDHCHWAGFTTKNPEFHVHNFGSN